MIEASKHLVMFLAAAAVLYMLARGSRGVGLAPWIPSSRLPAGWVFAYVPHSAAPSL